MVVGAAPPHRLLRVAVSSYPETLSELAYTMADVWRVLEGVLRCHILTICHLPYFRNLPSLTLTAHLRFSTESTGMRYTQVASGVLGSGSLGLVVSDALHSGGELEFRVLLLFLPRRCAGGCLCGVAVKTAACTLRAAPGRPYLLQVRWPGARAYRGLCVGG